MKKPISVLCTLLLTVCFCFSALADGVRVPIDFDSMTDEELQAIIVEITNVLESRGSMSESEIASEEGNIETSSEATDESLESLAEGATELNDESFLEDISAGLVARWSVPDQDTSLLTDKQMIEYYTKLVNAELSYVSKYAEYSFTDEKLGDYAQNYISALQSQFIAISEYYGNDEALYNEYWSNGYTTRAQYIYLINKAYGLNIPSKYTSILKEMVEIGIFYNISRPTEAVINSELSKAELELSPEGSNKYLYILPFKFANIGTNDITGLSIKVNFLNDNDVAVDTGYLVSYENVGAGKSISTNKVNTDDYFTHISFSYSFNITTNSFFETIEGTVTPDIQYSWDGTVKKNGELTSGQPVFEIENLISKWDMNTSWNKSLYVPTVKFDVRNTGTGDADRITVRCVFTNASTKEIWDEETTYVVGSSDSPLKVGYSKKAFIYSSVGYTVKRSTVPELTVDIYINDQLIKTVSMEQ